MTTKTESPLVHDPVRSARMSEVLKALAHPIRLRIIAILCEEDTHVNAMAERLDVSAANHFPAASNPSHETDWSRWSGRAALPSYHLAEPKTESNRRMYGAVSPTLSGEPR